MNYDGPEKRKSTDFSYDTDLGDSSEEDMDPPDEYWRSDHLYVSSEKKPFVDLHFRVSPATAGYSETAK